MSTKEETVIISDYDDDYVVVTGARESISKRPQIWVRVGVGETERESSVQISPDEAEELAEGLMRAASLVREMLAEDAFDKTWEKNNLKGQSHGKNESKEQI